MLKNHGANFQAPKITLNGPTSHAFFEPLLILLLAVTWLNKGLETPEKRDATSFIP